MTDLEKNTINMLQLPNRTVIPYGEVEKNEGLRPPDHKVIPYGEVKETP